MRSPALKALPPNPSVRLSAERRLRAEPSGGKSPRLKDLRAAVAELHIYEAELEIQNEELLDNRAQIEESQKKYFRHFDLAPVGLIRLNREGLILETNILGAQMLGEKRVLLNTVPRTFLAHLSPESHAVFLQNLETALVSGKMETCELFLRNADHHETFVRMQSVVSRSEKEETDFYITLTDLTERLAIENELELQKVLADAAVASKDLLFGMLSHELRTPLTPLVALLEDLAADSGRAPEDLEVFAIMRRNLDLETHLIDDLLDLTRMTGGKLQLRREITDVHLCLRQAIEICQIEIDGKGLQLAFHAAAPRFHVEGETSRLQQVFWNVIKNAVKFTPSGGRIDIETRCEQGSSVIIEIRDTGIGIEEWQLERIFDPFFQAQQSLRQRVGGLGLGLAISKRIAEAHGGTLTATSAGLDQGTTFRLELATVEKSQVELPGPRDDHPDLSRKEGLRVLLVEDHADTREVLARLLSRRGYDVAPAQNADEARILCSNKTFDVLVSDIALPDATGYELLAELTAKYRLRGVAMSGFGTDADLALSKAAGFVEHLVKPIDAKMLDAAIQRLAVIES